MHSSQPIRVVLLALAFTGLEVATAAVTFTIPLATLDDVRRLDRRAEVAEVILAARADSDASIFLAAYVTADDARAHHAGAAGLADLLVVEMGGYLASRGVEADRITGKGIGIDATIGRAVVISFGRAKAPSAPEPEAPNGALHAHSGSAPSA